MPQDRSRIGELLAQETERFRASHDASHALHERARGSLLDGVPMNWMTRWPGTFPIFLREAHGAHVIDVDGNEYVDLCLGDTGAMAGHSPAATVAAIERQAAQGITAMLPTEDSIYASEELRRRFGMANWQFTLSATDANRFVVRLARAITGRPRILVFNHCYHGSVDETIVCARDGDAVPRHGNIGPPVDPRATTRVVEFNDLDSLARALVEGDVACVLAEPCLTNVGIVLADPGFHDELRRLTRRTGTLLVIDETHTLCCGPGGYTRAEELAPDFVTIGKAIGGGVPVGAYGFTPEIASAIRASSVTEAADVGGIGGTLAGNALSLSAVRATLTDVLTDEAFERMFALAKRFHAGVRSAIDEHELPWSVTRLGCRVEYMFAPAPPRTGAESAASADLELDALLHLYMLNRGVLMTPFHLMALMSPATTAEDVDRHTAAFESAARALAAA